jgi:perosamine synthetase
MIPVSTPFQATRTMDYVGECVSTGWLSSSGRFLERFEREWAAYCGVRHGVAVTSGTAALHIAVAALELPPASEIIMPSFTIVSCVTAVLAADCVPVLVDVDPETWCMALDQVEARITSRTRALMPVHMYGHPVDMEALMTLARRHRLAVIEDAAEAHGVRCQGRRAGGIGDMGCFSFYANKIITTGEGGMVVTDDDALAGRLRMARNLGFIPERRFLHRKLGQNYRMTNMQAAVGVAQLEEIDRALEHKRWLAAAYREQLGGHNA